MAALTTTMVRRAAAATASTSSSWRPGRARVDLSTASVSCSAVSPTTTTAVSASWAARAAAAIASSSSVGAASAISPARANRPPSGTVSRATRTSCGVASHRGGPGRRSHEADLVRAGRRGELGRERLVAVAQRPHPGPAYADPHPAAGRGGQPGGQLEVGGAVVRAVAHAEDELGDLPGRRRPLAPVGVVADDPGPGVAGLRVDHLVGRGDQRVLPDRDAVDHPDPVDPERLGQPVRRWRSRAAAAARPSRRPSAWWSRPARRPARPAPRSVIAVSSRGSTSWPLSSTMPAAGQVAQGVPDDRVGRARRAASSCACPLGRDAVQGPDPAGQPEQPADVLVDGHLVDLARLDQGHQHRAPRAVRTGHHQVEPALGRRARGLGRSPVRHQQAVPGPLALEHARC